MLCSVGCACRLNTTVGFEIMTTGESPNNIFRVIECRDIDTGKVKGNPS